MRHIKYYYLSILILLLFGSCKKRFLDVPDESTPIRQSYVTDLNTTGDFLTGIYVLLARDFYYGNNQVYPDLVADNIKLRTATAADLSAHYNWVQFADGNSANGGKNMNVVWLVGYRLISSCNFVLAKADEYRTQNAALADNMKAQALALRAFVHFTLVNFFAQPYGYSPDASHPGIPYLTGYDWTDPATKRNSVAEVYARITEDLSESLSLFGSGAPNRYYMNLNAAKAILARVYLFKGDFLRAKNLAREIGTAVPIMPAGTNGYPSKLFTTTETEALFQLAPSQQGLTLPSPTGNYTGSYYTYFQGNFFISQKLYIATADIRNLYLKYPGDLRNAWVAANLDITKYPSGVVAGFTLPSASYYATLIRSSEMYLTVAESYANLGNEDSSRYYLNQIRTRANIPSIGTSVTGAALLDSVYLERRRELAFEGLRMFDLLRWKKGVNRQDAWSAAVQVLPYPSDKAIAPIPLNDAVILGMQQNPGY